MSLSNPTYILATEGINSRNTFSIASRGYTFDIFIEPVTPPVVVPRRPGGSQGFTPGKPRKEETYKNKVRIRVNIGGKVYEEEVMTTLAKVDASNVHIDVVGDEAGPKITVEVY